ncbi:ferric reductase-like transmembrane domain-containing protein [Lacibacter sp. MH-610]|uniref:Rieske 2Fe-2S domain-containing protein n=1 Tax=Lacibacter sp. MH-610 TaxID=3020883 RepID=UPI003892798D
MSTAYAAVGWNRQKKLYDFFIALFCISYLVLFSALTLLFNSEVTFETLLIRSTSTLALLLLHAILSIGPLTRLNKKFLPFLYNRRHLGVTMFCLAAVHGIFSIFQFHGLGNVNPVVSVLTSNTNFGSVPAFPFQLLGLLALIILFLMAITSHDFWLHNLSPMVWKSLHMMVYAAYALVVMHVMLGVIQLEKNPVFVWILFIGTASLIILHLLAAWKERKIDGMKYTMTQNGFVYVCEAHEIENSRAKIFCINEERIAVYRHENKLYAVHNLCKHQGGPLGEGKIIDGCITCPWHGYQYLPQNGQSPPPFKEKVSTYAVKVKDNKVWLNPNPFAEGTEQEGATL